MIDSLHLRNFKSFQEIEIPLGMLTLLSGVNGSGKSTILQSLAALKQSYDKNLLMLQGGLLLNGDYVELGVGKDVLCEYSESSEIVISVTRDGSVASWSFAYVEKDDLLQMVSQPDSPFIVPQWMSGGFQFLKADRIVPAVVYPKSYHQGVSRRSLGIRGQYAPYFLSVHQDESVSEERLKPGAVSNRLIDQVNAWLDEISPGVTVTASEIGGADLAQLVYRVGGTAGLESSNSYRATNVGFGLTYVLPVIVACLAARPGDLILLENPEAHLHPRGQTSMGELLCRTARAGVQIITESHSDHLLNGIRIAVAKELIFPDSVTLHFCKRRNDGRGSELLSPSLDAKGRLDQWPEGFFDEWERSLLELL
jgi:predicted ATPase